MGSARILAPVMIVTDAFVFLHLPKTGGTFVRAMLERVNAARRRDRSRIERVVDKLRGRSWLIAESIDLKHSGVRDIPAKHRGKPIVGCIRNPFDRLVSQYEFRWWARYPEKIAPLEELREQWPHFPELSFEEWYAMFDRYVLTKYLEGYAPGEGPGLQSRQLLEFYAHDQAQALAVARSDDPEQASALLSNVRFLHTDRLNQDLVELLLDSGMSQRWLEGVLEAQPIKPTVGNRTQEQRWQGYYSPEFLETVRRRDALVLALFPEYDLLERERV